jgi:hypothetical protein
MSEVEFPFMREELLYAVKALSDVPFQVAIWIDGQWPRPNYVFGFDGPFHALLDDMPMDEWGLTAIGTVLVSEQELAVLLALTQQCVRVVAEFGTLCDFVDVYRTESWQRLVDVATAANAVLGDPVTFP